MSTPHHVCHTSACSGPVPSHKQDTVVVVDFFAKAEVPRFVEEICGKETILDSSMPSLTIPPNGNNDFSCKVAIDNDNPCYSSFSSQKSDGTDSSEMDSSQKKLMSTPDISYIDMNLPDKAVERSKFSCLKCITDALEAFKLFVLNYKKFIKFLCKVVLFLGVTAYLIAALFIHFHRATPLLVVWCLVFAYNVFTFCRRQLGGRIRNACLPTENFLATKKRFFIWFSALFLVGGFITFVVLDIVQRPHQLISAAGYLIFLFLLFITSKYPDQVIWRPVIWGLTIQIFMGVLTLRTRAGFLAFNWLGNLARTFIEFVNAGVDFVFGKNAEEHMFAFKVLPIILYFSAFISVLYYLGAMQWLILKIAWLMHISLNTSATESMVAAGNIFVGQTESPLLIRPYIDDLTTSELHAVMTAGFGTIAGSVLGAYMGFGINPVYVITACVMASPCALAVSKLVYPETKTSKFTTTDGLELEKTDQRNVIEAAFVGASQAIPLVLNIGANLIAFLSLLAAINGFLGWFGGLVNYEKLSFQVICSYLFMPMTFLMGVEWQDCFKAAELIGTKIFLNEFIAYGALSDLIKARDNGTIPRINPINGETNWVDERTEAIVTYALCGFANIGSLGIMLGGLGSMAPKRQGEMAKIVCRALVAGIFVSLLNACIAGLLYVPKPINCTNILNTTNWNHTDPFRLKECCGDVDNLQLNPKYPVADFLCYITCVCLSTLIEALYLESYDVTVAQCMIGIPQAIHYPIVLQIFARITTEDKLSD